MATKWKVWVEIERIENYGGENETYHDEDCPISIGIEDSLDAAIKLQEEVENVFVINKYLIIMKAIKKRLEELREVLRHERISYGELIELQSLAKYIDKDDVELLEAAGVPEN